MAHNNARRGFLEKLEKYKTTKSAHKEVLDTNRKAIEDGRRKDLTSEEVTNEILSRDKRNRATTNLMATRRIRKNALEKVYLAKANEILEGAKVGTKVVLEATPKKDQQQGKTYQGKYVATDKQRGQIILETADLKHIKLDINQIKKRVK